ncbi:type II toxin-antitoxin system RelE/ParE family toxin [Xaviernesmea oryzae]|uniref:type II toxin-antitoxin system RelE/ParE family toxin n=1 Tax=Xaviernesmea oryzae TaxID=464029 RepID=UPI00094FCF5C|nr:type II toxin-antitoxin system RelE/ParE family toxin [Xaviernesmea oryzae]
MPRYKLSPQARRQIQDIWHSIAAVNEPAADKLLSKLLTKFELASLHPAMGSARPEISATARIIVEGHCLAMYEPGDDGIDVVVVVHGMRHPSSWLE